MMRGMVIDMNDRQLLTRAQLRSLNGTVVLDFAVAPEERYAFIARTVRRFSYARLNRCWRSVYLVIHRRFYRTMFHREMT